MGGSAPLAGEEEIVPTKIAGWNSKGKIVMAAMPLCVSCSVAIFMAGWNVLLMPKIDDAVFMLCQIRVL